MMTMFRTSLLGASTATVIDAAVRCGWLPTCDPDHLHVEAAEGSWRERFLATGHDAMARWGDNEDPDAAVSHTEGERTVLFGSAW